MDFGLKFIYSYFIKIISKAPEMIGDSRGMLTKLRYHIIV